MEIVRTLLHRRPELSATLLSVVPEAVFRDYLGAEPEISARVSIVPFRADVGVVQRDGLSMDHDATLTALGDRFGDPRDDGPGSGVDRAAGALAEVLAVHAPRVIVADVPPLAFAAARRLGVPSVAVASFDWSWIYAYYAERTPRFAAWAALFRRLQGLATAAVHLPPGPPLEGFTRVVEAAPIARLPLVDVQRVRDRLGVPRGHRAVLASFGGFGLGDASRRIPRVDGVTWILAPPMEDLGRDDTRFITREPYLAVLAACDAVLTKPGYGIVCEAARSHTRVLYTDRGDFPEYPWLVRWLDENMPSAHVPASELGGDRSARIVGDAVDALFVQPDRWPDRWDGAERAADVIEAQLG